MLNDNEIRLIGKAGANKTDISRLGEYRYFPEDRIYTVLFGELVSLNYLSLNKIITAVIDKNAILCSEAPNFVVEKFILAGHRPMNTVYNRIRPTVQALARCTLHPSTIPHTNMTAY
jgi:hypothetical protein